MEVKNTRDIADQRLTVLVYGEPGIGKTTLAKTCPGKTLIISAESGLLSLAGEDIDVIEVGHWLEMNAICHWLASPEPKERYEWIVWDSLSELGQKLVEFLKGKYPERKDSLVLWDEYSGILRTFIKFARDLKPYSMVFTALMNIEKDDLGRRFHAIDLNGKIAIRIPQFFDEVFAYRTVETEDGKVDRFLVTQPLAGWLGKDRSGKGLSQKKETAPFCLHRQNDAFSLAV